MLKLVVILYFIQITFAEDFVVRTADGHVNGSIMKDMDGKDFFSFQSIPFAKPPVGILRFKDPQPVEKWTNIRDATKPAPVCLQKQYLLNDNFIGIEDCLYLNVYTPRLGQKILHPVVVFIHGGGFIEGWGTYDSYGPEFLVAEGVVLVTLNYRLGILGFTSFDNPAVGVSGNAGLKDQAMALKWIKRNIRGFGGDPKQVTISGESAGAANVHLHVLSPASQGLFQRAVMQSGNALAPWCNGEANNGVKSAKVLGFVGDNEIAMLEFLQNANEDQLKAASINATVLVALQSRNTFGPTIERKSKDAFLTDTPRNIIKSGKYNHKVQLMVGLTSADGMLFDVFNILRYGYYQPWPTENFIPYYFNLNGYQKTELKTKIDAFYNVQNETIPYIALATDAYFTCPTYETVFGHLRHGKPNIYFYLFSSVSDMNFLKNSNPITRDYNGVPHMDDLWYLFTHVGTPKSAFIAGSKEYKGIKNSVGMFANFAKDGKPTRSEDAVQWESVKNNSIKYLDINLDKNTLGIDVFGKRAAFCCDIYKQYNVDHFCEWDTLN